MIARELPRDEWDRLAHTPLGPVVATLPAETHLIVIEDAAGAIVGTWAVMRLVHVEGIWIAEPHRKRGAVLGRLLRAMRRVAEGWGVNVVLTGADTVEVRELIGRYGGIQLPGEHFVLPVEPR